MSDPIFQSSPWRCACGRQMDAETSCVPGIGTDGLPYECCGKHPDCGGEILTFEELARFSHMAAVCGEDAAEKLRKEQFPAGRKRLAALQALRAKGNDQDQGH